MQKSHQAFRSIGEVAHLIGVATHVLRYWETQFPQLSPVKRADGRRYYRPDDVRLAAGLVAVLREDGLTIRGARRLIAQDKGAGLRARGAARLGPEWQTGGDSAKLQSAAAPAAANPPPEAATASTPPPGGDPVPGPALPPVAAPVPAPVADSASSPAPPLGPDLATAPFAVAPPVSDPAPPSSRGTAPASSDMGAPVAVSGPASAATPPDSLPAVVPDAPSRLMPAAGTVPPSPDKAEDRRAAPKAAPPAASADFPPPQAGDAMSAARTAGESDWLGRLSRTAARLRAAKGPLPAPARGLAAALRAGRSAGL